MTTTQKFSSATITRTALSTGWRLCIGVATAGLALVSTAALIPPGPFGRADTAIAPAVAASSPSALLDGEQFAAAVEQAVADISIAETTEARYTGRSVLLDGEEFTVAVDQALAGIDIAETDEASHADRSVLLDGERFSAAIDKAVADLRG